MRLRWFDWLAGSTFLGSVALAVAYPTRTLVSLGLCVAPAPPGCGFEVQHRTTLRIGIVLIGLALAVVIELLCRRGRSAGPASVAILALALGAYVPLWLASGKWGCFTRWALAIECEWPWA